MQMAVPVSWQPGSTMLAAMLAFFNNSSATNRSLLDASGSFKMFDSCCHKQNIPENHYKHDTLIWYRTECNYSSAKLQSKCFKQHMTVFTCKWDGLNKCETSTKACSASKVSARGSTDKIFLPLISNVDTKSPVQYTTKWLNYSKQTELIYSQVCIVNKWNNSITADTHDSLKFSTQPQSAWTALLSQPFNCHLPTSSFLVSISSKHIDSFNQSIHWSISHQSQSLTQLVPTVYIIKTLKTDKCQDPFSFYFFIDLGTVELCCYVEFSYNSAVVPCCIVVLADVRLVRWIIDCAT